MTATRLPDAAADRVRHFVATLAAVPPLPSVFNPWLDYDPGYDFASQAPALRAEHLRRYLTARQGHAKLVFVGEAPGYQGCRFSGIAMTSERMLCGRVSGVGPSDIFTGPKQPTSLLALFPRTATEPTATVAWRCLLELGLPPTTFLFWNAFPLHPYKSGRPMTNRAPTAAELQATAHVLPALLDLAPDATVVAVGRVAQRVLGDAGLDVPAVRHPANGGAALFRQQVRDLLAQSAT